MTDLASHYDGIYGNEGSGRIDLSVRTWPRDRNQAAVAFAGSGQRVLDIGCAQRDTPARTEQARHLGKCCEYIDHMLDHIGDHDRIEEAVAEGQAGLDITLERCGVESS